MNKEYMYLENGEMIITNHEGNIIKKNPVGNEETVLMHENDVERVQNIIDDSNLELSKTYKKKNNWKILSWSSKIVSLYLFISYFVCMILTSPLNSTWFNFSVYLFLFSVGANKYSNHQRKIINGINNKLLIANTIRQEYEKELEEVKQDKEIKNNSKYVKLNEPIKVQENELKINREEFLLNEAYDTGYYNVKSKKLVKK